MSQTTHYQRDDENSEPPYRPHRNGGVSLERIGIAIGIIVAIVGLIGSWVVLPYRVTQTEERQKTTDTTVENMREVLIRIDENVKELRRQTHPERESHEKQ